MKRYTLCIDEKNFDVEIVSELGNKARVTVNQMTYEILVVSGSERQPAMSTPVASAIPIEAVPQLSHKPASAAVGSNGVIIAPIPGKVLGILVKVGENVTAGQTVAIVEAMKMENNLTTPVSGEVKEIRVNKESAISTGDVIMVIEAGHR